jgi:hypothetical protein
LRAFHHMPRYGFDVCLVAALPAAQHRIASVKHRLTRKCYAELGHVASQLARPAS